MTSARKPIWLIIFIGQNRPTERIEQRYAAYNLIELLSHFNDEGTKNIIEIKKLNEEVTYFYE